MYTHKHGFHGGSAGKESTCKKKKKESACNAGDLGFILGLGSSPGEGHDKPLLYACLENPHGQRSLGGYNPWGHRGSLGPSLEEPFSLSQRRDWVQNSTDTHRHTDTDRHTHRHIQTHIHRHTHRYTHTQRHTHTHRHTDAHRHTQTDIQTHRHTQTHTDTDTHRHRHTQTHRLTQKHRHTKTHTDTQTQTHRHTLTHTHIYKIIFPSVPTVCVCRIVTFSKDALQNKVD